MSTNNTLFIGKVAHTFERLPSTNEYAIDLLAKTKPAEGTVILTADQYQGKGQFGSTWSVDAGQNLTLSIILYPTFLGAARQFLLSQVASLAVAETVRNQLPAGVAVAVKWPNDILVDDRKVAGILIQNSLQGQQLQWSVVGIGLNVNQSVFPAHLSQAASLLQIAGKPVEIDSLRHELFFRLEQYYLQLRSGAILDIRQAYAHQLYRNGRPSQFQTAEGAVFTGAISGVDEQGRLLIETEQGIRHFHLKEVSFLHK